MLKFIKIPIYIGVAIAFFLLVADFLIIKNFFPNLTALPPSYGTEHKIYHHDLLKSHKVETVFGNRKYNFCSDKNSFKTDCKNILREKKYSILHLWVIRLPKV